MQLHCFQNNISLMCESPFCRQEAKVIVTWIEPLNLGVIATGVEPLNVVVVAACV